jgi:preprotein translocase subunit SecB
MIKSEPGIGFKFLNYRISNFSYDETGKDNSEYEIAFDPTGIYNEVNGKYSLSLTFKADDKETKKNVITVIAKAEYKFDKIYKFEELPKHFFLSAIPIFFPYLRAFVSNLTLQANTAPLILGLINFTNMAEPLKENTSIQK